MQRSQQLPMFVLLALLVLATGIPGCVMVDERRDIQPVPGLNSCDSDRNCEDGLVCHALGRVCAVDQSMPVSGWVRLVPPQDTVLAVEEQYPRIDIETGEPLNLQLHRRIRVTGRVLLEGVATVTSLEANLVAVAVGEIPGLSLHHEARSTKVSFGDGQNKTGFELWLAQDQTYDVYVHPSEPALAHLPPFHVRRSFFPPAQSSTSDEVTWDIELPSEERYLSVRGSLLMTDPFRSPLAQAKVVAFSSTTGRISSTGISDEDGFFEIRLQPPDHPEGETYVLRLRPTEPNPVVPQLNLIERVFTESTDLGVLTVPGLSRRVDVTVLVMNESGVHVAGAMHGTTVRLSTTVPGGLLETETDLDTSGSVRMSVPPGTYVLTVVPSEAAMTGIHQELVAVPEDVPAVVFQVALKDKLKLQGRVLDWKTREVPGARITATFTGKGLYPETSPLGTRRTDTVTDSNGSYKLFVDPGQYLLQVDPPERTGLPKTVIPNVYLATSQQRTLYVSSPTVLAGRVFGHLVPSGETTANAESPAAGSPFASPVAGVRVEFYGDVSGRSSQDTVTPVPLAHARTDENGGFVLVLPADLSF